MLYGLLSSLRVLEKVCIVIVNFGIVGDCGETRPAEETVEGGGRGGRGEGEGGRGRERGERGGRGGRGEAEGGGGRETAEGGRERGEEREEACCSNEGWWTICLLDVIKLRTNWYVLWT